MFLVIIDVYSRLLEARPMPTITAQASIQCLRTIFPSLVYQKEFCQTVDQTLSAEYLKISSIRMGLSMWCLLHNIQLLLVWWNERYILWGVKKLKNGDMCNKPARLLFSYCITLQSTTGVSPVKVMMGRRLRSVLALVKPNFHKRVECGQHDKKQYVTPIP